MRTVQHDVDFCVVGGGLAGLCAAVAAARRGVKTLLMHDRPVLGGNASSEIRMWICGARGDHMRETGIIEEILLENRYRNLSPSYAVWDEILYGKAAFQENLILLLNCTCVGAVKKGSRLASVKGWQLTSETWHEVKAAFFADCSGDSILAPLSGAETRMGREASSEFGESMAPAKPDDRTMGMSCLLQVRETDRRQPFIPPSWAYRFPTEESLADRGHDIHLWHTNFWWIEVGGESDSIHGSEANRDELLKIAYGVWDHIKNQGDHGADNWMLEWVGFLPGKRESRRYVGDHVLTQNDVRAEGRFPDIVAYGGWPMDDHHPAGFRALGLSTVFHPSPSPYGIPFRSLYSRTVENLFCAGRNISASHMAMSSTRVMATCALLGQAVGTAAAWAADRGLPIRDIGATHIGEIQQALMQDDCYLPGLIREISEPMRQAELTASGGDPEPLRSGVDRVVGENTHAWEAGIGASVVARFDRKRLTRRLRLVFDSDLSDPAKNMPAGRPLEYQAPRTPATLVRRFHVETPVEGGGWREVGRCADNHQRLVYLDLDGSPVSALRLTVDQTWGHDRFRLFAWDAEETLS